MKLQEDSINQNSLWLEIFNTMGMVYPFDKGIDYKIELQKLEKDSQKVGMRFLIKNYRENLDRRNTI